MPDAPAKTASARTLYAAGDTVTMSGLYLCIACGYTRQFLEGERFPVCEACLAGTSYGPERLREEHAEYWQLVS